MNKYTKVNANAKKRYIRFCDIADFFFYKESRRIFARGQEYILKSILIKVYLKSYLKLVDVIASDTKMRDQTQI